MTACHMYWLIYSPQLSHIGCSTPSLQMEKLRQTTFLKHEELAGFEPEFSWLHRQVLPLDTAPNAAGCPHSALEETWPPWKCPWKAASSGRFPFIHMGLLRGETAMGLWAGGFYPGIQEKSAETEVAWLQSCSTKLQSFECQSFECHFPPTSLAFNLFPCKDT